MIPAYTLDQIRRTLEDDFRSRYSSSSKPRVHMVGVLFAPAGSPLSKDEILPRLDDFHHSSGNNIDFFCAGYGAYWPPGFVPDQRVVAATTDTQGHTTEWKYSAKYFNDLRKEVKKEAKKWKYSGEVDLLLFNAYHESESKVRLDFSACVVLALSRLKDDKVIRSVPELFERIFSYAAVAPESRVEDFSDRSGLATGRSWLVDLATAYLPLKLGRLWTKGRHYAVIDLVE